MFLIARDTVKLFINVIVKKIDRSNSKGKCGILKSTPSLQALFADGGDAASIAFPFLLFFC